MTSAVTSRVGMTLRVMVLMVWSIRTGCVEKLSRPLVLLTYSVLHRVIATMLVTALGVA